MKYYFGLLFFFIAGGLAAQQQYKGIMVNKLGSRQEGMITVNLNGPNPELIPITTAEKSKSKRGGKRTTESVTTTTSLNAALIHHIIINDTTYYFRDIKYDYEEKYYRNVCVRLLEGTLDCGMFQYGRSTGSENISVKLPKNEFSKLVSIDFDYYRATSGWHMMAFGDCKNILKKMEDEGEEYSWHEETPRDLRIQRWKKWIAEYNACGVR